MKLKQLTALALLLLVGVATAHCQSYWFDRTYSKEEQIKIDSTANTLSVAEMKEDIDFLCRVIDEVNPQIKVLSSVMGVDIRGEINKQKLRADSIETFEEYYRLAKRILGLCNEAHCGFEYFHVKEIDNGNINPYITEEGLNFTEYCELKYAQRISYIGTKYIDGKYFFPYALYARDYPSKVPCWSPKCADEYFPAGAQVLEIDGIPIDDYISKYYGLSMAWCFEHDKNIVNSIVEPYMFGLKDSVRALYDIKYKYQGKTEVTTMNRPNTRTLIVRNGIFSSSSNVYWFDKTKTLYIRIPQMDYTLLSKYKKKIGKYKNKDIDKVIIDIRGNGGGNDLLWEGVLSSIIKNPLSYDMIIHTPNTPLVRDYLTNIRKDTLENYKNVQHPKFLYRDSALAEDELDEILPAANSLAYDGNIYVVYDEDCYSSSLAFISVCTMTDQLISAGVPTNNIVGRSSTPFYFSLPNSKLVFRMIPCLDVSGAKTEKDLFDHSAELPIPLSIEDYTREILYKGDRYGKKYLLNQDNTIKTILELDENKK